MNREIAEILRKVPRKVVLGDCDPECADYLKPHVHGSRDVDYEGMADAVLQHLASQRQEQGTQERCALYLDMLARNHPHLAEAYRHAAHNLRAQTAETLALLELAPTTPTP